MGLIVCMSTIDIASDKPSTKIGAEYPIASKNCYSPMHVKGTPFWGRFDSWSWTSDRLIDSTQVAYQSDATRHLDWCYHLMNFWTSVKTLTKANEVGLKISHRKTSTKWQRKALTVQSVRKLMLLETISLDEVWLAEYVTAWTFLNEILFLTWNSS